MKEDLIFHITTKGEWRDKQRYGLYRPELSDEEGFIHCSLASQVQRVANTMYSAQRNLLLIVIDFGKLTSPVQMEDTEGAGEEYPHIYGPLNLDAVLDKIRLDPGDDGMFSIEFESNE